jgi:alpha,alpha-trehalase
MKAARLDMKRISVTFPCAVTCFVVTLAAQPSASQMPILDYIRHTWTALTRSHANLYAAADDPKSAPLPDGRRIVYVAPNEDLSAIADRLRTQMAAADFTRIELRSLPAHPAEIAVHGLLYLPLPYVVPGGRFNEMYGWDSFFIQMGLLRDGEVELAKDLADNFLYEVRAYGKVLNANRTYYLTRSQPPFLTQMVLAVYRRTRDRQWLESTLPAIEQYYRFWTTEPHLTAETGLSRYFDTGSGPAPEVLASEKDSRGEDDYALIRHYYRTHVVSDYDASQYYDAANDRLTDLFYKGDRSMRESGFDPSNRFGPFSVDIVHYNPVCLNSLLYLMEVQIAEIKTLLGQADASAIWKQRAQDRAAQINRLMWDSRSGLYFDYDYVHRRVRHYPFLTAFYPLWAGIATPEQAAEVARNLKRFERPGGLRTSEFRSGDQWDAPFGWAPLQWIAVEGLRRYGFRADADRVSKRFLSMVLHEYRRDGNLEEKYDVVRRTDEVVGGLRYGYHSNEAGFGWTNAVFTALLDGLPAKDRDELLRNANSSK